MRARLALLILCCGLGACSSWVDSTRAGIRSWCENNQDWCDVHAVK